MRKSDKLPENWDLKIFLSWYYSGLKLKSPAFKGTLAVLLSNYRILTDKLHYCRDVCRARIV